jgi:hypothetical protein
VRGGGRDPIQRAGGRAKSVLFFDCDIRKRHGCRYARFGAVDQDRTGMNHPCAHRKIHAVGSAG